MTVILSVAGVLLSIIVIASALLFGREWIRSRRERRFAEEVERHSGLSAVLRDGSPEEFEEALGRLRRNGNPGLREALLDKASEGVSPEARKRLIQAFDDLGITPRYIDDLRNAPSWERRAVAAERLGRIGSAGAVSPLLEILRDVKNEDEDVRGPALRALGRIRDPRAVPELIRALGSPEASLPPRIAEILVLFGKEAVEPLIGELGNMESDVRRMWAAEILGWVDDPVAGGALIAALDDVSPEVRAKAAGSLGKLKESRSLDRLLEMLLSDPVPFVRTRVSQALGSIGHPRVIDTLIRVLKDPEWWVRIRAIEALEQIGKPASGALLVALEDDDPEVVRRAATALERMGYVHESIETLERDGYRADVVKILHLVGKAGVTEMIFGNIATAKEPARKILVRLAGDIGNPAAGNVLRLLLDAEKNPSLRSRVVEALGKLAFRDAIPEILSCLRDPNEWVRRAAVVALSAMGPGDHVDELLRLMKDPAPQTRKAVCRVVSELGEERLWGEIERLLTDPAPEVRAEALRAAATARHAGCEPRILPLLLDRSEEVRFEAVRALASVGTAAATEPLLRAARGASDRVLGAIVDALANANQGPFPDLLSLVPGDLSPEQAVVLMELAPRGAGEGRLAFLEGYLDSRDSRLKRSALYALRGWGDPEGIRKHISRALEDPDEGARDAAVTVAALAGVPDLYREVARRADDPHEKIRFHVALALGLSQDKGFSELLCRLGEDPLPLVRAGAALGLSLLDETQHRKSLRRYAADVELCERAREVFQPGGQDPLVARAVEAASRHGKLETRLFLGVSRYALEKEMAQRARESLSAEERWRALEICEIVATGASYTAALSILKNDPSPEVRSRALDLIVKIRRDAEVGRIVGSLFADPHPAIRVKAAKILGEMEIQEGLETLLFSLDTPDRELREAVTTSLSNHLLRDPKRGEDLLKEIPSTKTRKLGLVWLLGKTRSGGAMKALLRYFEDEDGDVRAAAVGALAKFRIGIVSRHLGKALSDPNGRVRAAAVNALSRIRLPEGEERMSSMLSDPDVYVRQRAAMALLRMGAGTARDRVRGLAGEPEELRPVWVAGGVVAGSVPPEEALRCPGSAAFLRELFPEEEAVTACRESMDPDRRRSAFRVLLGLSSEAVPRVARMLANDPDPALRKEALAILPARETG
jgi:HEAT repeat protein